MPNWKGIEEICNKYGIPERLIYKWKSRKEITVAVFDGYPMIDEDSLIKRLEIKRREAISTDKLTSRIEKQLRNYEENIFIFETINALTPIIRLLIRELSEVITNDERKELFLYLSLQGDMEEYASTHGISVENVENIYKSLVKEVKRNAGFLERYRTEVIFLRALRRERDLGGGQ